ncbi:unnamed protein product [Pieris macdunnoughi]|uniref:Peptidase M12A domain-containing protein n=1 Tax=Pieris macdunnoughi TaxID=345717 RepID=A0A821W3A7_9NEOP|nr:unnamed protein product [Pieris macdunnoughi]
MSTFYLIFLFSNFILVKCKIESFDDELLPQRNFVYWPNATVPFYINSDHFDAEQSLSILSSLSLFAFKTCLKFAPVMAEPVNHHVLLIENPNGRRKCDVNNEAHSFEEPHRLTLGYECLKSPDIDMMIMRALGFPFEHNRASRDVFIDVQFENIESDTNLIVVSSDHLAIFKNQKTRTRFTALVHSPKDCTKLRVYTQRGKISSDKQ